jgi:hypothetical protein
MFLTPFLDIKSTFKELYNQLSNYKKSHIFCCVCYPWLQPYTQNKLQARSRPCVFIGYSNSQSVYICFDKTINKFFLFNSHFPSLALKSHALLAVYVTLDFNLTLITNFKLDLVFMFLLVILIQSAYICFDKTINKFVI